MKRQASRERKKREKETKKRKKAEKSSKQKMKEKKASKAGDDDGDGDDDDEGDMSGGESSDYEYADPFDISAEGDYNYMIAAVRNKKKTVKKNVGKWLKPFMGPPGGAPHEDEEAASLFKMLVKNGVAPDEVLSSVEKMVALVAPIPMREGMRVSNA